MTCAIVSIGTEITRGELVDTNSQWLAERLLELGHDVVEMATVDDDEQRIGATLLRLAAHHRVLVCTGGLGPTTDDLTARAVADVLGSPLVRDEASLHVIRERLLARGRTLSDSNAKQADFPDGAAVLPNRRGTAPGFAVTIDGAVGARAFFMPGVPLEMKEMFNEHVVLQLPAVQGVRRALRLRCFGLPEAEINDRLAGLEEKHGVTLGYRASFPEIEVKVLVAGAEERDTEARCRAAADEVIERIGKRVVYGEGDVTLAGAVGELLEQLGWRLALAESCTGGLVSQLITNVPGSSAYYVGGVCCYSNEVKVGTLGVGADTLGDHGAVSEAVARQMAEGACKALGADVALSITGIAGPTGGSADKPVGLVHWAVTTPRGTTARHMVFPGTRQQVQRLAAFAGLATVRDQLVGP